MQQFRFIVKIIARYNGICGILSNGVYCSAFFTYNIINRKTISELQYFTFMSGEIYDPGFNS